MPDRADLWRRMIASASDLWDWRPTRGGQAVPDDVAATMGRVRGLIVEARAAGFDAISLYGQALLVRADRTTAPHRTAWAAILAGLADLIEAENGR